MNVYKIYANIEVPSEESNVSKNREEFLGEIKVPNSRKYLII